MMRAGLGSPCLRTPVTCDLKDPSWVLLPTASAGKLFLRRYFSRVFKDFFSAERELFSCQISHDKEDSSLILSTDREAEASPHNDTDTDCSSHNNPVSKPLCSLTFFFSRLLSLAIIRSRLRLGFHSV